MKLSTLVTDYLAYKRALGQRFVTEGVILQSFCRQLGDGPVIDVTADRARAFIQGEHTSAATAARKHRALKLWRYLFQRHPDLHALWLDAFGAKLLIACFYH